MSEHVGIVNVDTIDELVELSERSPGRQDDDVNRITSEIFDLAEKQIAYSQEHGLRPKERLVYIEDAVFMIEFGDGFVDYDITGPYLETGVMFILNADEGYHVFEAISDNGAYFKNEGGIPASSDDLFDMLLDYVAKALYNVARTELQYL